MNPARSIGLVLWAWVLGSAATLPYQGLATDTLGNPVKDGPAGVSFSLHESQGATASLWAESQLLDMRKGLFSAQLGQILPIPDSLLRRDTLYLGLRIGNGASLPRIAIQPVAKAIWAKGSDSALVARDVVGLDGIRRNLALLRDTVHVLRDTLAMARDSVRSLAKRDSVNRAALDLSLIQRKADSVALEEVKAARRADSISLDAAIYARKRDSLALATIQAAFGTDTSTALQSLQVGAGLFAPGFQEGILSYVDSVERGTPSLRVVAIPASIAASVTYNGGRSGNYDLSKDSLVVLEVTNGGRSRRYEVRIYHRTGIQMRDVRIASNIADGLKFTRPFYPSLAVGGEVDTTGLKIRYTTDGMLPDAYSDSMRSGEMLGFASPTNLSVSAWRGGIQVGPVQSFFWDMDSCIYDFNQNDTNAVSDTTAFAKATKTYGYTWSNGANSSITALRQASTLGTSGLAMVAPWAIGGGAWPSVGIGLLAPYLPGRVRISQNFTDLQAISLVVKDQRVSAGSGLKPAWLELIAGVSDPQIVALSQNGVNYGVELPVSVATQRIRIARSDLNLPAWTTETLPDLASLLPYFQGIQISIGSSKVANTGASGALQIDQLVYHFR